MPAVLSAVLDIVGGKEEKEQWFLQCLSVYWVPDHPLKAF